MAIDSAPADPAKHRAPLGKASSGNQKGEALGTSGAGRVQSTAGDVALTRSFEQKKRQVGHVLAKLRRLPHVRAV